MRTKCLVASKPDFDACRQQRHRSSCASAQSDQRLWLLSKRNIKHVDYHVTLIFQHVVITQHAGLSFTRLQTAKNRFSCAHYVTIWADSPGHSFLDDAISNTYKCVCTLAFVSIVATFLQRCNHIPVPHRSELRMRGRRHILVLELNPRDQHTLYISLYTPPFGVSYIHIPVPHRSELRMRGRRHILVLELKPRDQHTLAYTHHLSACHIYISQFIIEAKCGCEDGDIYLYSN